MAALVAKDKTFWHNAILRGALFKLRAAMRTSLYPFGSLRGRYTIFPNLMHLGSTDQRALLMNLQLVVKTLPLGHFHRDKPVALLCFAFVQAV